MYDMKLWTCVNLLTSFAIVASTGQDLIQHVVSQRNLSSRKLKTKIVEIYVKYGLREYDIEEFLLDAATLTTAIVEAGHGQFPLIASNDEIDCTCDSLIANQDREFPDMYLELVQARAQRDRALSELTRINENSQRELNQLKSSKQQELIATEQQCVDCRQDLEVAEEQLFNCRSTRAGLERTFAILQEEKYVERLDNVKATPHKVQQELSNSPVRCDMEQCKSMLLHTVTTSARWYLESLKTGLGHVQIAYVVPAWEWCLSMWTDVRQQVVTVIVPGAQRAVKWIEQFYQISVLPLVHSAYAEYLRRPFDAVFLPYYMHYGDPWYRTHIQPSIERLCMQWISFRNTDTMVTLGAYFDLFTRKCHVVLYSIYVYIPYYLHVIWRVFSALAQHCRWNLRVAVYRVSCSLADSGKLGSLFSAGDIEAIINALLSVLVTWMLWRVRGVPIHIAKQALGLIFWPIHALKWMVVCVGRIVFDGQNKRAHSDPAAPSSYAVAEPLPPLVTHTEPAATQPPSNYALSHRPQTPPPPPPPPPPPRRAGQVPPCPCPPPPRHLLQPRGE